MPIDLHLLSLPRQTGPEHDSLPGLMVFPPPRKAARSRERETLFLSLLLNGNTILSHDEYQKLTNDAAAAFHNTHGALTSAMRAAANLINRTLLERNLATTSRGQYTIGWLTLAALREEQLTLLQCGPTHVLAFTGGAYRHLHDPALSGKGLGISQGISQYFSQIQLQPGDRLLFCPKLTSAKEIAFTADQGRGALDALLRRFLPLTDDDASSVLIHVTDGTGVIHQDAPAAPPPAAPAPASAPTGVNPAPAVSPLPPALEEEKPAPVLPDRPAPVPAAHVIGRPPVEQPSAYAIPPQPVSADEELVEQLASAAMAMQYPPSAPSSEPPTPQPTPEEPEEEVEFESVDVTSTPRVSPDEEALRRAETRRRLARAALNGIQAWRSLSEKAGERLRKFLPNLLPGGESDIKLPLPTMTFVSILIPILMATIGAVVYLRFGVNLQYETSLRSTLILREQALAETDPVRQREAWENVRDRAAQAVSFNETTESQALYQEAQVHLDQLLGRIRMEFVPLFSVGGNADISRMAASDTDLYMLDANNGNILWASINGNSYKLENFNCGPGAHGNINVGGLVDLLVLPKTNMLNSSVLGVDAFGNLLYCAPGVVPRPMALPLPPTNWKRVTAMTLDGGDLTLEESGVKLRGARLYVLDAPARMVWVYTDHEGVFVEQPLMFFGNQIPQIEDAIDMAVSGDELYLLHADGRVTHCLRGSMDGVLTRCDSPAPSNPAFQAYGSENPFEQAHFTQMILTSDASLLLLDADGQAVDRISTHAFELQGILTANSGVFSQKPLSAMAYSPARVLYLASESQIYAAFGIP